MKRIYLFAVFLCIILFLPGCAALRTTPTFVDQSTDTIEPLLPTQSPVPTATAAPCPTPTSYQPVSGKVILKNMLLWQGPGYLFPILENLSIGQPVNLLGRAPGNNWLNIQTADGSIGWMQVEGIELEGNLYDAPEITPQDALIVEGRVFAPNGAPATEVTVMINVEGAVDTKMQDVAVTGITGRFYFFMPSGTDGKWTIVANSWSCRSTTANAICSLIGQFPPAQVFTLPEAANTPLEIRMLP